MWPRTILPDRGMMWATVGITAAYALTLALVFYPTSAPSRAEGLLILEGLFAGPMMIACVLSILMTRAQARRVIIGFQVTYILLTLITFYSTFTGEQDAQYQLRLLFIPLLGFPGVVAAGVMAACLR